MNKIISVIMCLTMVFVTIPTTEGGYKEEYEYEQIIENQGIISIREVSSILSVNSDKVNVEVKYDVSVTPPKTFYYTKTQNGKRYGGTLNIVSIRYRAEANYALYTGYIYPIE